MRDETPPLFERVIEFFERSRFEYLSLDLGPASLRLSREPGGDPREIGGTPTAAVLAPSVGFVEPSTGHGRFAARGERVEKGAMLFALRRFSGSVPVLAPASGRVADVLVQPGEFVEFGQALARFHTDSNTEGRDGVE
jgi:hypothetical protein